MTLLAVHGLSRSFGAVAAVADVGFSVAAGEAVAIIGPNGAGKTTCFNLVSGGLRPDAGRVVFAGVDIVGRPPHEIARLGIGRTFQVATVFRSMTAIETVQTALAARRRGLYRLWRPLAAQERPAAEALLDQVGLAVHADRPAAALAHGDLKRLDLAMALAMQPRLLIMDEPTAGVAAGERRDMMARVAAVVRERDVGVLFTEHDLDVVFGYADRVIVLHRGRMVADGSVDDVRRNPEVQAVYLGGADPRETVADGHSGRC